MRFPFLLAAAVILISSTFAQADCQNVFRSLTHQERLEAKLPAARLEISKSVLTNSDNPFVSHRGPGKFDNALALDVVYEPVRSLRPAIEQVVGRSLKFFTEWSPEGEAHVTVITPPEFSDVLGKVLTMAEIDRIALREKIQSADLRVLGIGSGKAILDGKPEETFFLIVDSNRLREIRHQIYRAFVSKGGDPNAWDPTWWFPHITIGYTRRDLWESDGVTKNIRSSWDSRFTLKVR